MDHYTHLSVIFRFDSFYYCELKNRQTDRERQNGRQRNSNESMFYVLHIEYVYGCEKKSTVAY